MFEIEQAIHENISGQYVDEFTAMCLLKDLLNFDLQHIHYENVQTCDFQCTTHFQTIMI